MHHIRNLRNERALTNTSMLKIARIGTQMRSNFSTTSRRGTAMKSIGLIGGMSFESTAVYYRLINETVRARRGGLASADILLHSVDFAKIVEMQKAGRWDLATKVLADSARRLEAAGASCVLICTNTMHLVADEVAGAVRIPLIHIIDET